MIYTSKIIGLQPAETGRHLASWNWDLDGSKAMVFPNEGMNEHQPFWCEPQGYMVFWLTAILEEVQSLHGEGWLSDDWKTPGTRGSGDITKGDACWIWNSKPVVPTCGQSSRGSLLPSMIILPCNSKAMSVILRNSEPLCFTWSTRVLILSQGVSTYLFAIR